MSENLFSPEAYVEGVAGSVAGLQRTDIYGLLLDCPAEHLDDLLQYLYEARPDMTDHVENLILDMEDVIAARTGRRPVATQSPRDYLHALGRAYPLAWSLIESAHQRRSDPDEEWPDWCYCPIGVAAEVIAHHLDIPVQQVPIQMPETVGDLPGLAAVAAWRMTLGIYRFDDELFKALTATPITGDLPAQVLLHLPEWCVYIETPGMTWMNEPLFGFWAHHDQDYRDGQELRLLLHLPDRTVALPTPLRGGLVDGLTMLQERMIKRFAIADRPVPVPHGPEAVEQLARSVEPLLSLVLYLCSEQPDLLHKGQPAMPANPTPKRTRRRGERVFAAQGPKQWDVGVRLGAALRAAYERTPDAGESTPTGTTMRPHVRRAHWHTFLSGPRLRKGQPIPSEQRRRDVRWMPPIAVNVSDLDALPAVIRPVR